VVADAGLSLNEQLRVGSLIAYSLSDAGSPNSIFTPRPFDNLLTEKWLIGPHLDWKRPMWKQRLIYYDHDGR